MCHKMSTLCERNLKLWNVPWNVSTTWTRSKKLKLRNMPSKTKATECSNVSKSWWLWLVGERTKCLNLCHILWGRSFIWYILFHLDVAFFLLGITFSYLYHWEGTSYKRVSSMFIPPFCVSHEVGTSYSSFSFVTFISSFCASGVVSLPAKWVTELSTVKSNNRPSEKPTTSLTQTDHLPPFNFTIELIFKPLRSGHTDEPQTYISQYKITSENGQWNYTHQ